jgi:hypothetical protein
VKTRFAIFLGAVLGVVLLITVLAGLIFSQVLSTNQKPSTPNSVSTPKAGAIKSATPTSTSAAEKSTSPAPNPTSNSKDVSFSYKITSVNPSTSTTTATARIEAQIMNIGKTDAHNVVVTLAVVSQGTTVRVNSQDSITKKLGTIQSGEMVNDQIELTISLADGLRVQSNGATFNINITSDEAKQTATYEYHP